jgi:hypothetical protein
MDFTPPTDETQAPNTSALEVLPTPDRGCCPHCGGPLVTATPFTLAHSAALDWCLVLHEAVQALTAILEEDLPCR